jgi:rhodanese-related sulfurtransferase
MNRFSKTCAEILILVIVAGIVGIVSNSFIIAKGININENYFPELVRPPRPPLPGEDDRPPDDAPEHGLQVAGFEDMVEYADLLFESDGFVVILDARTDEAYQEGHISGALQVNHYQKDKYLPDIMPMLEEAGVIVVYCNGGDCEDSILLATSLIQQFAINYDNVYVYEGGIKEWQEREQELTVGNDP